MNDTSMLNQNSQGWNFFVRASFGLSVAAMVVALVFLPTDIWVKGYLAMGTLLVVASSFTLAKAVRDDFEASKVINRISEAKAEKMIKEMETA